MVAIVKYNAGNIRSVLFALDRLRVPAVWTDDPAELRAADKVIFPGVGEASSAMRYLRERGLAEVLTGLRQPVLGICLGLQLFCRHSEEGDTACLGIFDTAVRRFDLTPNLPPVVPAAIRLKVPHMGWDAVQNLKGPLFFGVPEGTYLYFVHSYYAERHAAASAEAHYGIPYSAALQRNNFYAVQFHPEKSGAAGQRILKNFLNL